MRSCLLLARTLVANTMYRSVSFLTSSGSGVFSSITSVNVAVYPSLDVMVYFETAGRFSFTMLHYGLLDSRSLDGGHYERLSVVIQGLDHVNRKKPAIQQNPAGPYPQFRAFFEQFTHDIAVIIRFLDEPDPKRGPGSAGHAGAPWPSCKTCSSRFSTWSGLCIASPNPCRTSPPGARLSPQQQDS